MSSYQGRVAVHPLADYQLVSEGDPSTAQDSAHSSQFGYHALSVVQEELVMPHPQALWQKEILGQQHMLGQLLPRAASHPAAARQYHHYHQRHPHHSAAAQLPRPMEQHVSSAASDGSLDVAPHTAHLYLAPLMASAAADVVRAGAAGSAAAPAGGGAPACGGIGGRDCSRGSSRSSSGRRLDAELRRGSSAEATGPDTPPHIDSLLQAAYRVAGQARMRMSGSKRPSEGSEGGLEGDQLTSLGPVSLTTVSLLTSALATWQWDAFAFVASCPVRPLTTLSLHLLRVGGLVDHFSLPLDPLAAWLGRVEEGYSTTNPYHNATHAIDVLQKMHMIMSPAGGLLALLNSDPLLLLGGYLAAVVHDYQHTGLTNDFLVNVGHDLAITYNDKQPHENHHIASAWRLTRSRPMDFLSGLPQQQRTRLRRLMVQLVLATDMQQHNPLTQRFSGLVQQAAAAGGMGACAGTPGWLQEQQELVLQVALKVADLGHLTNCWAVHQRWVAALEEEFFQQGDQERAQGMPLTPMMDRSRPGISSSQTGFLDAVALPLLSSLALMAPGCGPLLVAAQHNRECWKQQEAAASAATAAAVGE